MKFQNWLKDYIKVKGMNKIHCAFDTIVQNNKQYTMTMF